MQVLIKLCWDRRVWMDRMHSWWFNMLLFYFFLFNLLLLFLFYFLFYLLLLFLFYFLFLFYLLLLFLFYFLFDCILVNNIIVLLRFDMVWIFVVMIVRINISWVITCSWDAICSPRMIKDIVEFFLSNAKVVVITDLMERVLNRMRPSTASSQSKLEFKEASTSILIPNMLELFSAW